MLDPRSLVTSAYDSDGQLIRTYIAPNRNTDHINLDLLSVIRDPQGIATFHGSHNATTPPPSCTEVLSSPLSEQPITFQFAVVVLQGNVLRSLNPAQHELAHPDPPSGFDPSKPPAVSATRGRSVAIQDI